MTQADRHITAALSTLILLQLIMLSALYAGIRPHPPEITPLFGIAPFIGAAVSIAVAAIISGPLTSIAGRVLSIAAAIMALLSFGPQKYMDTQFGLIWPAVVLGQIAALAIFALLICALRRGTPASLASTRA